MKIRCCFLLVVACVAISNPAEAACPTILADELVPNTAWNSPSDGAQGISLDSSYRVSGQDYVLSAVDPRNSGPVMLFRFDGASHDAVGSPITANTSSVSNWNSHPDAAATTSNSNGVWASVWEGYGDPQTPDIDGAEITWVRRFDSDFDPCANPYPDTSDYEKFLLPTDEHGGHYFPVVDAIPGTTNFVVAAVAFPSVGSEHSRPYLKIVRADGTTYLSETLVESATDWSVLNIAVDAYTSTSAGTLIAVAWSEVSSTLGYRIRFKLYNSNGTVYSAARQIDPPSGYGVSNPRIAGVGNAVVLVWNRWLRSSGFPYGSSSFMIAYPASSGNPYYTARLVNQGSTDPTYMPDISAAKWTGSNGSSYSVYSISYYSVIEYLGVDYLYPTIHLFKTTTSPIDISGAQYISWYPKANWNPLTDGVKTEVFVGCASEVVIGGVHYAESALNPAAERGLRRSFFSVSGGGVYSASIGMPYSLGLDQKSEEFEASLTEFGLVSANPYAALENGGYLESAALLGFPDDEESVE